MNDRTQVSENAGRPYSRRVRSGCCVVASQELEMEGILLVYNSRQSEGTHTGMNVASHSRFTLQVRDGKRAACTPKAAGAVSLRASRI